MVDGSRPTGSVVSGAATGTLVVSKLGGADAGQYWLEAKNSAGVVVSSKAEVKVASAPVITQQLAAPVGVKAGGPLLLSVVASGTNPVLYQWKKNGVIVASTSSATYQIAKTATTDAGKYSVRVYNSYGEVLSNEVAVVIDAAAPAAAAFVK